MNIIEIFFLMKSNRMGRKIPPVIPHLFQQYKCLSDHLLGTHSIVIDTDVPFLFYKQGLINSVHNVKIFSA